MPPSAWSGYGVGPPRDGLPTGAGPHRGRGVHHRRGGPRLDDTTAGGEHPRGACPSRRAGNNARGSPYRGPTPPAGLLVRPLGEPPWARRVSEMLRGLRLRQTLGLVQSSLPTGSHPALESQYRASKCKRLLVFSTACSPSVSHRLRQWQCRSDNRRNPQGAGDGREFQGRVRLPPSSDNPDLAFWDGDA